MGLLTDIEKKQLNSISLYLQAYGLEHGLIVLRDGEFWSDTVFDENHFTRFDNGYNVEIPEMYYPILQKIYDYSFKAGEIAEKSGDYDSAYETIEITLYTNERKIEVEFTWGENDVADGETLTWDLDDDGFDEIFEELDYLGPRELTVYFNGSGDEGYLDDVFQEESVDVPEVFSEWCNQQLSAHFGNWEDNNGGIGLFKVDLNEKIITLNFAENIITDHLETIFSESF